MQAQTTPQVPEPGNAAGHPPRPCVYELFAADGALLYIGRTINLNHRVVQHRSDKQWWPEVAIIRLHHCDTQAEAAELEARLVREKTPRLNERLTPEYQTPEVIARRRPRPRRQTSVRGVSYMSDRFRRRPWRVACVLRGERFELGQYATEQEAAEVARAFWLERGEDPDVRAHRRAA